MNRIWHMTKVLYIKKAVCYSGWTDVKSSISTQCTMLWQVVKIAGSSPRLLCCDSVYSEMGNGSHVCYCHYVFWLDVNGYTWKSFQINEECPRVW